MIPRDFERVLDAVLKCVRQMGCHSEPRAVTVTVFDRQGRAVSLQFNEHEALSGCFNFNASLHWQGMVSDKK